MSLRSNTKILLMFLLYTSLTSVVLSRSEFWGKRIRGDRMIYSSNVTVKAQRQVLPMHLVKFPLTGRSNNRLITAIHTLDNFRNKTGFTSFLKIGGPGRTYATILLKGFNGKGFNATVVIYGR
ncbi:uncharacterized protein LOC142239049 [Haematobia irritans]|uniref:uncharacterized protein LOC142239049 n=1 Tax=Haematobia irritans TaxID=7368 RepID=UPI003F504A68